jgi:hypothetical protein
MINLGGSVGKGGKNVRADVIAVQNLINLSYPCCPETHRQNSRTKARG